MSKSIFSVWPEVRISFNPNGISTNIFEDLFIGIHPILRLRHNPKILGGYDAEIVGDSIAELVPFCRNGSRQEGHDGRFEFRKAPITSVMGRVFVHHAPAS